MNEKEKKWDEEWTYGTDANGNPVLGDDVLNGYLKNYQNRDKFSYDLNSDALYKQYKDQYMHLGKLAAEDVMGQASAMTGGYGNSYAATVGNQAYQSYLGKLNDVIPELYQLAYDKYNKEGQDLLDKIDLLQGERDNYYNRYRDSVVDKQWQDNFDLMRQQYEDSKFANAGGQYKIEKDESGNPVVTPAIDETIAAQPTKVDINKIIQNVKNYTSKSGQADYLAGLVNSGKITQEQAMQILEQHGVVELTDRNWEMKSNGGTNWFWGIDENAEVGDEFGNKYTLKELKKELEKTMSSKEAKNYIMELQEKLGI